VVGAMPLDVGGVDGGIAVAGGVPVAAFDAAIPGGVMKLALGVDPLRLCVADATNDEVADNDVANGLSWEKSKLILSLWVFFDGAATEPL
jgi:hypothetical protein